jgi:hypothetical protein
MAVSEGSRITMRWSNREVRELLSVLDRPQQIERTRLGLLLKHALGLESAREAVIQVLNATFAEPTRRNVELRNTIMLSDMQGNKRSHVASSLGLSQRTFFRRRAAAVAMVAAQIDRAIGSSDAGETFKFDTARLISTANPKMVSRILEREAYRIRGEAAYEAVQSALNSGRRVSSSLLERCTGYWRLLAELEIARSDMGAGDAQRYRRVRDGICESLERLDPRGRARVGFELAYVDRLDAIRRGDVDDAVRCTDALIKSDVDDGRLRALAVICEAEQVCDFDLAAAGSMIRGVQELSIRLNDFRLAGRAAHALSIIDLLAGEYAEAADLSSLTLAALDQAEPSYLPCAASIEGRAQLLLGCNWDPPGAVRERFPEYWVTSFFDCVAARHVALANPRAAYAIVERSADAAKEREAPGSMVYATGTRAIVQDLLGKRADAQRLRVAAWETGLALRDPFYTFDLFIHPRLPARSLGAFDLDDGFLDAIDRRLNALLRERGVKNGERRSWRGAIAECLGRVLDLDVAGRRSLLRRGGGTRHHMRNASESYAHEVRAAYRQLATDLSFCLSVEARTPFIERFSSEADSLIFIQPALHG